MSGRSEKNLREVARTAAVLPAVLVCLAAPLANAEEAWRPDGRHLPGRLTLDRGELHFKPSIGEEAPLARFTRIRFADAPPAPFRAGGGRRVRLRDGEAITGQILGLDGDKLVLRTAWAERIELPRAAVMAIDSLPGWRTMAEKDWPSGAKELKHTLGKPLSAGRVGVDFQVQGALELLFQQGESTRRVTVTVAEVGARYAVDAGDLKGAARAVARTAGWHRLIVQFSPRSLRITCDDDVLWYNLEQGPGGLLKQVTARSQSVSGREANVSAPWTEFCLERAVTEYPHPPVAADQDEIWLADGDQLFGHILRSDRKTIEIDGRFGKRSLPWTMVAGCTFRKPAAPPPAPPTTGVRLLLRSGLCPQADVLEGTVTALDERRLKLRHALLGELILERGRVRELRPLAGESR